MELAGILRTAPVVLAGTESTYKPDAVKIGIMLLHQGRDTQKVYKTLLWSEEGDDKKLTKYILANNV